MAEYRPLMIWLSFFLFIALIFPFLVGYFLDLQTVESSNFTQAVINTVTYNASYRVGVIVGPYVQYNPIHYAPDSFLDSFTDSLVFLGLLPDFLLFCILILSIVGMLYAVIKLFPTT